MNTYDERDTIFSRMELQAGTPQYNDYYSRHPERKAGDDAARLRAGQAGPADDRLRRLSIDASFGLLEAMRPLARGTTAAVRLEISPQEAADFLCRQAESYGAVLTGTALLGDACFYAVRGRGAEYGQTAETEGRYGIVFAVRMNPEEISQAPTPRAAAEVVNGYSRVALIGLVLARTIREWGWSAACTMDGRADVVLPVAARYAGLGSIGRSGLLLTDDFGPCVRLGAVVSDLPLERTLRQPCKAAKVCESCQRCAAACPAGAISQEPAAAGRFAPVNDDACFAQWQKVGTDCGLCLSKCPLSRITAR
ncbi:MAG: hypothetical protein KKI09_14170 [Spirochaetes bacterium]|nr:hypothetical protein [Spirochaetota bacterium]MBU0956573.1 hypothetical protein [Spirochaetota bacterium]